MNKLFKTVTNSLETLMQAETIVPFKDIQNLEQQILIEGLELMASIGILDSEKEAKQRVILDLIINLDTKETYHDNIDETVSYADLIEETKQLVHSKHFNLVETLAEDMAQMCFQHSTINKIEITVKKPDIIQETLNVGFKLTQQRL